MPDRPAPGPRPVARRGQRRHHPGARHRVRGRLGTRVRRRGRRRPRCPDRGPDRARAAGEEPLRLHRRPHPWRLLRRAARRGRGPARLGDAAGPLRQGDLGGDLRPWIRQPCGDELRRGAARRLRQESPLQQGAGLRLRDGPGRGDRGEVRRRSRGHLLRIPHHRRHADPADPPQRHLHLRARGERRPARPDRGEVAGGAGLQGQDCPGAHSRRLRPRLRGRAAPQGADPCRVRRQPHAGVRVRHDARAVGGGGREDRGGGAGRGRRKAGRGTAAGPLGGGGGPQDAARLRAHPGAPAPPPDQRCRGRLAHGST